MGEVKPLKLTFEKAALFTLILIIGISTANIYSQFLYIKFLNLLQL